VPVSSQTASPEQSRRSREHQKNSPDLIQGARIFCFSIFFSNLLKRFEYNTLDTRFRYRPARYSPPDPRIVIVSVDPRSQEVLGKWPFPRKYFAQVLDTLRGDGVKVAAFDITFNRPDQTSASVRVLWARQEYPAEEPLPDWDGVFTMTHK